HHCPAISSRCFLLFRRQGFHHRNAPVGIAVPVHGFAALLLGCSSRISGQKCPDTTRELESPHTSNRNSPRTPAAETAPGPSPPENSRRQIRWPNRPRVH